MVLTDEQKQFTYPAVTLEDGAVATESSYYAIDPKYIAPMPNLDAYKNNNGNPPFNNNPNSITTDDSKNMYMLKGLSDNETGLGITLKVMSGDNISILGKSAWLSGFVPVKNNGATIVNDGLLDLLTAFASTSAVATATHASITGASLLSSTATSGSLIHLFTHNQPTPPPGIPKAYINWIFFDEQFKVVETSSGFDPVGGASNNGKFHDHKINVDIPKNGYLYVYCSNESSTSVYFDNLQVVHNHGPLVEETHYYPFGLTMAGISSKAAGEMENKYKYIGKELQNKEFSDGSGLELYDYGARMQDPQLGRWCRIDNKAEIYQNITPYAYAANQPTNAIDKDGNLIVFINGYTKKEDEKGTNKYWRSYHEFQDFSGSSQPILDETFDIKVSKRFNDNKLEYLNGGNFTNASDRYYTGYNKGYDEVETIINGLHRTGGVITESIKIVAHSMGAIYSKGFVKAIVEYAKKHPEKCNGLKITEYDFAAFQQNDEEFSHAVEGVSLFQFDNKGDLVVGGVIGLIFGSHLAKEKGREEKGSNDDVNPNGGHMITDFINAIPQLSEGKYKFIDGKFVKQ